MHAKAHRALRPVLAHLESQGARVVETWQTKKGHYRLLVSTGTKEVTLTAPFTHGSEDPRTFRNWKAQTSQLLRALQAQDPQPLTQETEAREAI